MAQAIPNGGWRFDNSYARLPEPLFAAAEPATVRAPRLVVWNRRFPLV